MMRRSFWSTAPDTPLRVSMLVDDGEDDGEEFSYLKRQMNDQLYVMSHKCDASNNFKTTQSEVSLAPTFNIQDFAVNIRNNQQLLKKLLAGVRG